MKSKQKGVTWAKGKWIVRIRLNGKRHRQLFDTEQEAISDAKEYYSIQDRKQRALKHTHGKITLNHMPKPGQLVGVYHNFKPEHGQFRGVSAKDGPFIFRRPFTNQGKVLGMYCDGQKYQDEAWRFSNRDFMFLWQDNVDKYEAYHEQIR